VAVADAEPILDDAAAEIERAARETLAHYQRLVAAGSPEKEALAEALTDFEQATVLAMSAAFGRIMDRSVSPAAVAGVIRQHARAAVNATELARALYDGYNTPRNTEPLQVKKLAPRREVQELMRLSMKDPATRVRIEQLQRMVLGGAGIRTAGLRSAYQQLFAEAINGASEARRDRALRQVIEERNRYFANRIAQTEIARAHADRVADEFMADPTIEVVEVRMSPSHPVADICDLFARQDKYGLGPGLYPKFAAPKPIFHPHCRCRLVSRPDVAAKGARERTAADRTFLRSLPTAEAARVMGSRERLQQVLRGADVMTVVNAGVPDRYHVRTMEQGAASPSPSSATLPKRVPFRGDETVGIVAEEAAVKKHPLYSAAKGGDIVAAATLVPELMNAAWLAEAGAMIRASGARLVGVHALEALGVNPIGAMMADWVGYKLDMPVDRRLFQINEVGHTGAPGWHRLRSQAMFAGPVEAKATYWLLDDFIGQGGTMANLRGWIEANGGRVAGFTALAGQARSAKLGLSAATLAELRDKHGRIETWWRERFGFGFDSLTESEARYLIRAEDADTIRTRLSEG
jgi:hypothetical protein